MEFKWAICSMCGPHVIRPKCGNNCCNGTYGGKPGDLCDVCPSAYDVQHLGPPEEFKSSQVYLDWSAKEAREEHERALERAKD
jgi:hypothetical protein